MSELPELDPLIHATARLRIMSTLAALEIGDTISFSRLKTLLQMTGGNLLTHLRKLADADYVVMSQSQAENTKTTSVALTDIGRTAFATYRADLQQVLGTHAVTS